MRLCIASLAVAEGWLLLDIGWFVLFLIFLSNIMGYTSIMHLNCCINFFLSLCPSTVFPVSHNYFAKLLEFRWKTLKVVPFNLNVVYYTSNVCIECTSVAYRFRVPFVRIIHICICCLAFCCVTCVWSSIMENSRSVVCHIRYTQYVCVFFSELRKINKSA